MNYFFTEYLPLQPKLLSPASLEIQQTDLFHHKAPGTPVPAWVAGCAV